MASRPYFKSDIVELERLLSENRNDREVLNRLADELDHRKTDRAKALQEQVRRARKKAGDTSADHANLANAQRLKASNNGHLPLITAEEQFDRHKGSEADKDGQPQLD